MNEIKSSRRGFLMRSLTGAAAVAAAPFVKSEVGQSALRPETSQNSPFIKNSLPDQPLTWKNYSGTVVSHPRQIVKPKDLVELQEAVKQARQVRAVGAGHCYNQAAKTDETLIETKPFEKILQVDRDRLQVKVEAGCTLAHFNSKLAKLGLALPSMGDIAHQTLGGLVATATHGTGIKWGTMAGANALAGVELVTANGDLLSLSSERPADDEMLKAARVSLGALGVTYSVTLNVVPAHNLELTTRPCKLHEALNLDHCNTNDHYEFWFFPFTENAMCITRNVTTKPKAVNHITRNLYHQLFVENLMIEGILKAAYLKKGTIPGVIRDMTKHIPHEHAIDRSDKIMVSPRLFKTQLMEYAFPINKCEEAVAAYLDVAEEFAMKHGKDAYFAHLPCEVRFVKGDEGTFLSPTNSGGYTCYVDLTSHAIFHNYAPFFQAVEERFLALGGKPHWGKHFYKNPMPLYPQANAFLAVREKLDPQGKFLNDFSHRLFAGLPVF
jgi:FAD/FMN-containing dehydrogenase